MRHVLCFKGNTNQYTVGSVFSNAIINMKWAATVPYKKLWLLKEYYIIVPSPSWPPCGHSTHGLLTIALYIFVFSTWVSIKIFHTILKYVHKKVFHVINFANIPSDVYFISHIFYAIYVYSSNNIRVLPNHTRIFFAITFHSESY